MKNWKWKNISIGSKYSLAFSLMIIFILFATSIVFLLLRGATQDMEVIERYSKRSMNMTQMISLFRAKDTRIADYIMTGEEKFIREFDALSEELTSLQSTIESSMETKEQKELFKQIKTKNKQVTDTFELFIVPAIKDNNYDRAVSYRTHLINLRSDSNNMLTQLKENIDQEQHDAMGDGQSAASQTIITLIVAVATSLLIGGVILWLINRNVHSQLQRVVEQSKQIASGNLAVENIQYVGKDEIGQLALGFNTMLGHLRHMVNQMQHISEEVKNQSDNLTTSSEEVNAASQQVASTMEELSSGVEDQAEATSNISQFINDLEQNIHSSDKASKDLVQLSKQVTSVAENGQFQMEQSVEYMNDITGLVTETVEKVEGLEQHSLEVTKLVEVIENVADQTNLLALNAAIEAARAGEAGKGFSVVAEEVRKLAEQVSLSVGEITEITKGMQEETMTVVQALKTGYEKVELGNEQIHTTLDYFEDITDSIFDMRERTSTISDTLTDIATRSASVSQSVQEISASSEETAASVEENSATTQQQSSSMQQISENASSLARLSSELNTLIRMFIL